MKLHSISFQYEISIPFIKGYVFLGSQYFLFIFTNTFTRVPFCVTKMHLKFVVHLKKVLKILKYHIILGTVELGKMIELQDIGN